MPYSTIAGRASPADLGRSEGKHFRFFVAPLLRMTWALGFLRYYTYPLSLGGRRVNPFPFTKADWGR